MDLKYIDSKQTGRKVELETILHLFRLDRPCDYIASILHCSYYCYRIFFEQLLFHQLIKISPEFREATG